MATILVNGCFDLLHEGHQLLLCHAKFLGCNPVKYPNMRDLTLGDRSKRNRLVAAVNSDASARRLKAAKWGERYPIDDLATRMMKLAPYCDEVIGFDTEEELHGLVEWLAPCVLCKGPDYAGKAVTGDDLAPVIILDCPEPESVKQMKVRVYGQQPYGCIVCGGPVEKTLRVIAMCDRCIAADPTLGLAP